ncbi:YeeE/YedE family protein [Thalassobacter stenotrophicus]|uniref:YeeE/YedE family protein n=1 Tax=Thalassobacter stenotrophicus TaxID=266809 RepID=UPI0022A8E339|nr:YeeE/YedE family protein [Thalassobacter stenotrophicus]UYP67083.1 YeeE/YedE family protein [Thalassobacter stenotrophicus]
MLLDYIPSDLNVQLLFGLALGVLFGIAAQITRFCLRRSVAGEEGVDRAGLSVWLLALATAIAAVQFAVGAGYAVLEESRYLNPDIPALAIVLGGLAFGVGMVLTRGCVTRLTVLSATGNMRALTVLVVFAITAHAMMKGILAPLRTTLGEISFELPFATVAAVPGIGIVLPVGLIGGSIWLGKRGGASVTHLGLGAFTGLLVAAGWIGTSTLLMDEFDPSPVQSIAFTLPWTDSLFWVIASTAIPAGFGTGLIGGVMVGAFLSALVRSELTLVSFAEPQQTVRYGAGGVLMGIGGVLAGGCTIGAGLSGVATLSLSAMLALVAIVTGAVVARYVLGARSADAVLA